MSADLNFLWQRLVLHLRQNGNIAAGLSTPSEIAEQANLARRDDLVGRFVDEYLYPVIYGGEDGGVIASDAAALVDRIIGPSLTVKPTDSSQPKVEQEDGLVTVEGIGVFSSIKDAIHAAPPGATIHLSANIYRESVTIDKDIILAGKGGRDSIIIRGAGGPAVTITRGEAVIRNLSMESVRWNNQDWISALRVAGGQPLIEDCRLDGSDGNSAGLIDGDSQPILKRCEIACDGKSTGLHYSYRAGGQVIDSRIDEVGVGITLQDRVTPTITKTTLGPSLKNAAVCKGESHGSFIDSVIMHDASKIIKEGETRYPLFYIEEQAAPRIENCTIKDSYGYGIYLENGSCFLESTQVLRSGLGGIRIAGTGNLICRRSVVSGSSSNGVLVDDTSTASLEDCQIVANKKTGLLSSKEGRFDLLGSKFNQNAEDGIGIFGQGGKIQDCEILDNIESGIYAAKKSRTQIIQSNISKNKSAGIVAKEQSRLNVTDCNVSVNAKSGLDVSAGSIAKIHSSRLFANGYCGAIAYDGGRLRLEVTESYENLGPAILSQDGSAVVLKSCRLNSKDAAVLCKKARMVVAGGEIQSMERSGVELSEGARATLSGVKVKKCGYIGVLIHSKSYLRSYDVAIADAASSAVWVRDESRAWIRSGKIMDSKEIGIRVSGNGKIGMIGAFVKGNGEFGIKLEDKSTAVLSAMVFEDNKAGAVSVGAQATLRERGSIYKDEGRNKIEPGASYAHAD